MLPVGLGGNAEVDVGLLAPEQVGRDRNEALFGEFVAGLADIGVHAEHFVQNNDGGSRQGLRSRDVGAKRAIPTFDGDAIFSLCLLALCPPQTRRSSAASADVVQDRRRPRSWRARFSGGDRTVANEAIYRHYELSCNGGGGSLFDELGCFLRVRHVGHMAGFHFDRLGVGALRHHPFLVRIDRSVFGGHHVPGGFGFQAGIVTLWVNESVEIGTCDIAMNSALSSGMSAAKSAAKCCLVDPPVAVAVRLERLGGLRQGLFDRRTALAFIESKCGNIDKRCNVWMIAGLGDDRPAITVADQNHWPAHGVDRGLRALLVLGVRGLGGLRHRHPVPIILEDVSDGFPAGAVGESSMHQNHVLNTLIHDHSPLQFEIRSDRLISNAKAFGQTGSY